MKKILVPGGTGAMGVYLVPELLKMGYQVDVISLVDKEKDHPNVRYIKDNACDIDIMREYLKNDYDAVVDFMVYYKDREEHRPFIDMYLENTSHYIYLSTYRVYANEEHPIKETSPRLLDVSTNEDLLRSSDYCIHKALGEEYLRSSGKNNWTVVRPAITYSQRRFQLVTLEMNVVIRCMREGIPLVLPEEAMNVQATMSWAGDVAKMISRIVLNDNAKGEIYTVATSEHHTWGEIADMYGRIGGLKYITVDAETYVNEIFEGVIQSKRQLEYDRLSDRIMDNTKILNLCGMKQSELMPLEKGLSYEYSRLPKDFVFSDSKPYLATLKYINNLKQEEK